MRTLRPKWTVQNWSAWRCRWAGIEQTAPRNLFPIEDAPGGGYEVEGARIVDHQAGLTYEATIETDDDGRRWLSSVNVIAHGPDSAITGAIRIPAYTLAEQVALQLAANEVVRGETRNDHAFNVKVSEGLRPGAQDTPSVDQIGQDVRGGGDRHTIAAKYGVTKWTADKWLAKARRAGTVPAATRGRPARKGQDQ